MPKVIQLRTCITSLLRDADKVWTKIVSQTCLQNLSAKHCDQRLHGKRTVSSPRQNHVYGGDLAGGPVENVVIALNVLKNLRCE